MPNYRRAWLPGGCYFLTMVLQNRKFNSLLTEHIDLLRDAIRKTRQRHPFFVHAWIVLPDHMHCLIELPEDDADFALRVRLIKTHFSRALPATEWRSTVRLRKGERGIWQKRFWEHQIFNERDFCAHMDYIHFNPVKHGLVKAAKEWPYSTFHRLVRNGVYPLDWGGSNSDLEVPE